MWMSSDAARHLRSTPLFEHPACARDQYLHGATRRRTDSTNPERKVSTSRSKATRWASRGYDPAFGRKLPQATIDRVLPLSQFSEAFEMQESGKTRGKLVFAI